MSRLSDKDYMDWLDTLPSESRVEEALKDIEGSRPTTDSRLAQKDHMDFADERMAPFREESSPAPKPTIRKEK